MLPTDGYGVSCPSLSLRPTRKFTFDQPQSATCWVRRGLRVFLLLVRFVGWFLIWIPGEQAWANGHRSWKSPGVSTFLEPGSRRIPTTQIHLVPEQPEGQILDGGIFKAVCGPGMKYGNKYLPVRTGAGAGRKMILGQFQFTKYRPLEAQNTLPTR